METFFDQIFRPLEDYFLDDYYLAASLLVQVYINSLYRWAYPPPGVLVMQGSTNHYLIKKK